MAKAQHRSRENTKQDYQTPWDFMSALVKRFGELGIDLAGTEENQKAPMVITRSRILSLSTGVASRMVKVT